MSEFEFQLVSGFLCAARGYSLFLKGNDLVNLSKYDEIIKLFDEAIDTDPASVTACNAKGAALGMAGRYEEALMFFEKAIEIDVESDPAWENKGEALRAMGRIAESNSAMIKARQLANRW